MKKVWPVQHVRFNKYNKQLQKISINSITLVNWINHIYDLDLDSMQKW